MTQTEFNQVVNEFNAVEPMRSALYFRIQNLINAGYMIEAHLLFLATWNFAGFRYALRSFNLDFYESLIQQISMTLQTIGAADFSSIHFEDFCNPIISSFDKLAAIEGIKYTGASKILHLLYPKVFIMWDQAISGQLSRKKYVIHNLDFRRFNLNGTGYYEFMLFCKEKFQGLISPYGNRTLAKCIDEYNFYTITRLLRS